MPITLNKIEWRWQQPTKENPNLSTCWIGQMENGQRIILSYHSYDRFKLGLCNWMIDLKQYGLISSSKLEHVTVDKVCEKAEEVLSELANALGSVSKGEAP